MSAHIFLYRPQISSDIFASAYHVPVSQMGARSSLDTKCCSQNQSKAVGTVLGADNPKPSNMVTYLTFCLWSHASAGRAVRLLG